MRLVGGAGSATLSALIALVGGGVIVVAGLLLILSKSKPNEKDAPVVPEPSPEAAP